MNSMPLRRSFTAIALVLIAAPSTLVAIAARADELPRAKASMPENFVEVRRGLGGAYYVDAGIKKRYDDLFAQVQALQADVQQARISETDAQGRIAGLRKEIQAAVHEIREKEIFVTPATVHKKRQSQTFTLGAAGVLLVKAQQVQIIGWDKPHVEAVVEKVVLSTGDEPVAADLHAIKLVHRETTGAEALGRPSRKQRSDALLKLTPQLLAKQRTLFLSMFRWYARLDPEVLAKLPAGVADDLRVQPSASALLRLTERIPFEGIIDKKVDVIQLDGISYQAGNRSIILEITNKDGAGSHSSVWRRHARLMVYVPKCKLVGVYGGHAGIVIRSLDASVELQMQDVPGIDAPFRVTDVTGSLVSRDVPLELVENVSRNVDVIYTDHVAITSGPHYGNVRGRVSAPREKPQVYRQIGGHFIGWFVQSGLRIDSVAKELDIRNDFGDTVWTLDKPLAEANYRIVSECGAIQLRIPTADTLKLPVMALAEVGDVFVPSDMKRFESLMYSLAGEHDVRHGWHGFATKLDASDHMETYNRMQRVAAIVGDQPRSPGIDLVTRAGSVRILVASPPADD